jgi:hypothetical protein
MVVLTPVVVVWLVCVGWTELDMGGAWYALGLLVVPTAIVASLSTREMARRWGRERGALIDGDALSLLHRQVLCARVGRTLGVTLAWSVATMVTAYYNTHIESFAEGWARWNEFESAGGVWALSALGYVVASVVVEATKPRLRVEGSVAAVLDRRTMSDLLDLGMWRLLLVYGGAAAVATLAWVVARVDSGAVHPSPAAAFPLAVGLGAVGAAEWASRRRQRVSGDDELAVEELTRTATTNAVIGAAIAMFAWHAGAAVSAVWDDIPPWLALPGILFACFGAGIWFGAGTKFVFRTRRIDALRAAA